MNNHRCTLYVKGYIVDAWSPTDFSKKLNERGIITAFCNVTGYNLVYTVMECLKAGTVESDERLIS
jgi:exosome complex RNA-binding protein Csl4